jgi:hypothetical protein
MSTRAPRDLDQWDAEVRQPAEKASEGRRVLKAKGGNAEAWYEVAPLPNGRWAVKVHCAFLCGDFHGVGIPWRDFATREECLAYFLAEARAHFSGEAPWRVAGAQEKARKEMQRLLGESVLFTEPTPEAPESPTTKSPERKEPPMPQEPRDKPPVQGLLF